MDNFKKVNPDFEIMFIYEPDMNDIKNQDLKDFILGLYSSKQTFYNGILNRKWNSIHLMSDVGNIVLLSDAFRFYILNKYGGIYLDLDTFPVKPFDEYLMNSNGFSCYISNKWKCDIFFMGFNSGCVDNNLIFIDCQGNGISFASSINRICDISYKIYKNKSLQHIVDIQKKKFEQCKYPCPLLRQHEKYKQYYLDHFRCNTWTKNSESRINFVDFWGISNNDTPKENFYIKEIIRKNTDLKCVTDNHIYDNDIIVSCGFGSKYKQKNITRNNRIQLINNEAYIEYDKEYFKYFIGADNTLNDSSDNIYVPQWMVRSTEFMFDYFLNRKMTEQQMIDRKFCCFVGRLDSRIHRKEFIDKLSLYKTIDIIENNGNYLYDSLPYDNGFETKINHLNKYKFVISFENADKLGYVTEKAIDPILSQTSMIYFGNKESFNLDFSIDPNLILKDSSDYDRLVEYIKKLDNDNKLYINSLKKQFLKNNRVYLYNNKIKTFFTNICNSSNI